jgi:hypothetical protein
VVKTRISTGNRITAIALALIYVFAMSTYINFLSNRTHVHHHHHHSVSAPTQRLSAGGGTGNFFDKQHGAFKSIRQSKSAVISSLYSLIWLAVLTVALSLWLFYIDRFTGVLCGLISRGRPYYLRFRVLRI